MSISIPKEALRCVVRGRHSHSVQDGPNETRTLTREGVELCTNVRARYAELGFMLSARFGDSVFACSPYPRSLLTTFLVTGATQIHTDERLALDASVKKSPDPVGDCHPNLYAHWKAEGLSISVMLQRLAADTSLFGDQPVGQATEKAADFVRNAFPESRLVLTFDHEPAISLLAAQTGKVAPELLGLEECEAMIFFLDADGNVIAVEKFIPSAFEVSPATESADNDPCGHGCL